MERRRFGKLKRHPQAIQAVSVAPRTPVSGNGGVMQSVPRCPLGTPGRPILRNVREPGPEAVLGPRSSPKLGCGPTLPYKVPSRGEEPGAGRPPFLPRGRRGSARTGAQAWRWGGPSPHSHLGPGLQRVRVQTAEAQYFTEIGIAATTNRTPLPAPETRKGLGRGSPSDLRLPGCLGNRGEGPGLLSWTSQLCLSPPPFAF